MPPSATRHAPMRSHRISDGLSADHGPALSPNSPLGGQRAERKGGPYRALAQARARQKREHAGPISRRDWCPAAESEAPLHVIPLLPKRNGPLAQHRLSGCAARPTPAAGLRLAWAVSATAEIVNGRPCGVVESRSRAARRAARLNATSWYR